MGGGGLPLSRLAAGEGDVAQVEHRKWVSLCVENPALQRHQVIAGEQQVEIPAGGEVGREEADGKGRKRLRRSWSG